MILGVIERVTRGEHLDRAAADAAMEDILAGRASDAQIAALLTALRTKGESLDELVGFAAAMRRHATPIFSANGRPSGALVDTCGTGGDARGTFNVSTAAAFVVAGAGVRVAKHGNRSISSRCGSADVLEALGVNIALEPALVAEAIEKIGIGFLFAPRLHSAMKHAMPARKTIGGRTVFNLLGPLTNPAGATAQLLGVFAERYTELVAQALGELGSARALVVHGADGLDEISLSGETSVAELCDGEVRSYTVVPEDFGLQRAPLAAVAGGDADENAAIIRRVLAGEPGPPRDIVLANAAAALVAAGRAADWRAGAQVAVQSIDSGAAAKKLEALVALSKSPETLSRERRTNR